MAQDSKIEWTHHTVNLWWGCTKVHEGCDNCYAEYLSDTRYKNNLWGNDKPRRVIKSAFSDLDKYQKLAESKKEVHRVFVGSMMDIFEKPMPLIDSKGEQFKSRSTYGDEPVNTQHLRAMLFDFISRGKYNNLLFLFLTKRPSNINKYIPEAWKENPPENVMFGTSPVSQETANKLIPQLLRVNGYRFLSIEPQLSEIDLCRIDADKGGDKEWCMIDCLTGKQTDMGRPCLDTPKIDWIIQGGESGHNRRPFNLDWAYKIKLQCHNSGTPYFFKQIDKVLPVPDDLMIREFPNAN